MNSAIRRLAVGAIVLMLALMANSTYLQAFRANELNGRNDNRRVRDRSSRSNRGPILIGSTPIAQSKEVQRPVQVPAHLHQRSAVRAGDRLLLVPCSAAAAIELNQNSELNGSDPSLAFRRVVDVTHQPASAGRERHA